MKLYYYYDKEADVFYLSQGKPGKKVLSREMADDVVLRLDPKTGQVVGFTILNFSKRATGPGEAISLPIDAELLPAR